MEKTHDYGNTANECYRALVHMLLTPLVIIPSLRLQFVLYSRIGELRCYGA